MENEEEKLYIDLDQKSLRTPREFLNELIVSENNSIMARCKETYTDQNLTSLQCQRQKLRSFDDIYILFKTYFPEITEKEVTHLLITFNKKITERELEPYIRLYRCKDILRPTFYYSSAGIYFDKIFYDKEDDDYYDLLNSKYDWKDLLANLNINNEEELIEYIDKYRGKDLSEI